MKQLSDMTICNNCKFGMNIDSVTGEVYTICDDNSKHSIFETCDRFERLEHVGKRYVFGTLEAHKD